MIPLIDLSTQYRSIKHEIGSAITGVLETSQFILGPEVAAFENEFAAYCGAEYGVGVNSGTSALHLALLAAGIGPGDEVQEVLSLPMHGELTIQDVEKIASVIATVSLPAVSVSR